MAGSEIPLSFVGIARACEARKFSLSLPGRPPLGARRPVPLASGVAADSVRSRVPDLVGSRRPSHYHFRVGIQSFQALAAPFPSEHLRDDLPRPRTVNCSTPAICAIESPWSAAPKSEAADPRSCGATRAALGRPAQAPLCDAGSWKPWSLPSSRGHVRAMKGSTTNSNSQKQ
jgi:hypothetical protein